MSENEFIEGSIVEENNDLSSWFLSSIKGDLDFIKKHVNDFVGSKGEGNRTALMYAAETGNLECVEFLSKFDKEIGQQDENGNTAMMYAAKNGFMNCIEVLVDEENNIFNNDSKRAYNIAYENGHYECAGFLELYEFDDGENDEENNNTDDNSDDSNTTRNLIKENKRLKSKLQVIKKVGKDVDKNMGVDKQLQ